VSPRMTSSMLARFILVLAGTAEFAFCANSPIKVTEATAQGQPSYRIETPAATWIYHREGGGFCALLDSEGNDWISYRPTGGAAGNFRGIPNAIHRKGQEGNNFFHPGHAGLKGSETKLVSAEAQRVVLRTQSRDQRWTVEWEILPDRAVLRFAQIPTDDDGYWILYEGTPGGRFEPRDSCVRPGHRVTPLGETWEANMKDTRWVGFSSATAGRTLLLVAHDGADVPVSYRPMQDAMTVFGFGRTLKNLDGQLHRAVTFTVGLVAETDPIKIAAHAERWVQR
jgi:hypothetical protein